MNLPDEFEREPELMKRVPEAEPFDLQLRLLSEKVFKHHETIYEID